MNQHSHHDDHAYHHKDHDHSHGHGRHGHAHGSVDPTITTSAKGIWAIKWSFGALAVTALTQVIVVWLSGSVALLADTIHNFADAATVVPLWIAFALSRWQPRTHGSPMAMAGWKMWPALPLSS